MMHLGGKVEADLLYFAVDRHKDRFLGREVGQEGVDIEVTHLSSLLHIT